MMEGLILLILCILPISVYRSLRVNRSDIIGIRCSVIVRIAVVVRISGIGSGNHLQNQTFSLILILFLKLSLQLIIALSPCLQTIDHPYEIPDI